MKYGQTLRQRSIPAWSHHNIDYDDIKHFIKENTTPGKGKTVSIPGRPDDKLRDFENELFHILADQHQRIDLFVKSKRGEIQRRLEHSRRQLGQLSARRTLTSDNRIPVNRLERFSRLENEVVKAGEEIKSLARFVATQRTAFRKLLKKYKKWTGSADLEERFRDDVLEDPKGFTKLDLGPLLDEYSDLRQSIRSLYDNQVQKSQGGRSDSATSTTAGSSSVKQLQENVESGFKSFFDTAIATVPLGSNGTFASYFVHPENVVELQMLLLQHARFFLSRSRSSSLATPVSSERRPSTTFGVPGAERADFHMLTADNLERFAKEQSALTVNDREHAPGTFPQRAKVAVRWNDVEDARACLRSKSGRTKSAWLKKKHIRDFFDKEAEFYAKSDVLPADSAEKVEDLRSELLKDDICPLFHYSSCRSRMVGLDDGPDGIVMATLDTGITIQKGDGSDQDKSTFPFALLLVRQEGYPRSQLVPALDESYLVERVRGFSIEYHSVWQTQQSSNISPPFWLPILSRDIRKLPPPALKRSSTTDVSRDSGTPSIGSGAANTDDTTAVETSVSFGSQLETPPLRSFRKKKRRGYPQAQEARQEQEQPRYWSEYDHPEDGDDQDAFVIFIDPNEKSAMDRFFEKIAAIFRRPQNEEHEALLTTPPSPQDDESSSEDEESGLPSGRDKNHFGTFGQTMASPSDKVTKQSRSQEQAHLGQFESICFTASLVILVVAYILRSTGRHKVLREVEFGVLFAMVCSLAFVLIGFMAVLRGAKPLSVSAWGISITILVVDIVGSGGLLAWMLG